MSENKHVSIPKKVETEDQLDFHFLRRTGIKYIEELGGKLWTDFNSHDPGISTLEVLSYAITDLGMRMDLNMEDILASDEADKGIDKQFIKASDILPARPLNALDYRKLFIDISLKSIAGRTINDCWLEPRQETMYADCKNQKLAFSAAALPDPVNAAPLYIKGLYDLYVDYAEGIEEGDCDWINTNVKIMQRYNANRSLCEDLVEIKQIETQQVAVCARINVVNKADEELVHAKILRSIRNYLAPEVHFYSLKQMLDKGYTTDEIFDGPLLENGFIDTEELKNSQLRREVRLSDIINVIMKVDGVKEIQEISIAGCDGSLQQSDNWLMCIERGKKPELCELSSFSYSKGSLPLNINQEKVEAYLKRFKDEEKALREDARYGKELVLPEGTPYDIGNYSTILNEFPDTYGVGNAGIIGVPTDERKALALQFQGYLLFFDTVLASYFKHLEKVKEQLSVNGKLKKTYFTQALKDIDALDTLINEDYRTDNDDDLTDSLFEELDNSVERQNEIYDHLIARFAEKFSDYTFLMKSLYGNASDEIVLSNKQAFLSQYKTLSADRGLGYDYSLIAPSKLWDTDNVSGVQKRIAGLLGIKNYTHRNVSKSPILIKEAEDENGDPIFTWKVKDGNNIILCSVESYHMEYSATKILNDAIYQIIQIDKEDLENKLSVDLKGGDMIGNMQVRVSGSGRFYFEVLDEEKNVIAVHKRTNPYIKQSDLKLAITRAVDYFKYEFTEDGIMMVEHLMLKPTNRIDYSQGGGIGCMILEDTFMVNLEDDFEEDSPDSFMVSCAEGCARDNVYDPYSYRVSIVLPGYTNRNGNPDFRKYAETLIREELPAHVLAKICWVGNRETELEASQGDLYEFERTFKKFLSDKARNAASLGDSTKELIDALSILNNVYRPGRLLDCATEDDSLDGKIILGQSNIK